MHLPGFHGRHDELSWLRSQWDACTARDPATGRFAVAFDKAREGLRGLGAELLRVEATGDYAAAKTLLDTYAVLTPEVQQALDGLKDVPVDVRPVFTAEEPLRGPQEPLPGETPATGGDHGR